MRKRKKDQLQLLGAVPQGRPIEDARHTMRTITFRIDDATFQALRTLEKMLIPGVVRGKRSIIIRRLILEKYNSALT